MIIAAIPVKNNLGWTAPLVEHLLLNDKVDQVWVYDNGSTDQTTRWVCHRSKMDQPEQRLFLKFTEGMSIYEMWNDMIKRAAEEHDNAYLAILNNDIRLAPNAIHDIANLMKRDGYQIGSVDPTRTAIYTHSIGWWDPSRKQPEPIQPYCDPMQPGDRVGWAFVVQANFWRTQPYAIHPDYKVWYGDDDLYRRCMYHGGRACVVRGIGSDHAERQSGWDDKMEQWNADKNVYIRLWGDK